MLLLPASVVKRGWGHGKTDGKHGEKRRKPLGNHGVLDGEK
jgi:hypothetical protein